jgi:alpha-ribazole phosphatase
VKDDDMLILVRHGRTTANAAGLLSGRVDVDLDDVGRAQVEAAARCVAAIGPIHRIVASPLQRTRDTAAAVAAATGAVIDIDDRWLEMSYGDFDGQLMADVGVEVWAQWRSDPHFRPPNGESLAEVAIRVTHGCEALLAEAVQHNIVVVSHVSPIKAAVAWALGTGPEISWRTHLDPASITRIACNARGGPVLRSFNEVSHLDSIDPNLTLTG